jgi:peroxiredoxin/outer membrane lipoprotein-sorting protein
MPLFALLLMPLFQIQTIPANLVVGSWVNQDSSTSGVTEIAIDNNEGHLRVHVWGKCEPRNCDWGITDVGSWNGLTRSVFDMGFVTTTMEFIPLPDSKLLVVYKDEYKDKSGRSDQEHVEFFVREQPSQDPESLAAKVLLKKVAEAYRTISTARFESETFVERAGQQSAQRRTTLFKMTISQPGKLRIEETGSSEPSVIISDGKTVWEFFPESNEYTATPAGKQGFGQSFIAPYSLLNEIREPARIIGFGRVADTDCTMLTIGRDGNHTRTLWIDPHTNFIRRDEAKDISTRGGASSSQSSTTTFSVARAIDTPDSAIFSFDPGKTRAIERRELQKAASVTSIGTLAPEFTLRNLQGEEVRLSDLRGKIVVLDFWATWCPPCHLSMPTLELLSRQFKDKGLVVLGIDDEDPKEQSAFLASFGYSFSSLVDPATKVKTLYNVEGIPATILVDRQGKIKTYDVGTATYESLWEGLQALGISAEGSIKCLISYAGQVQSQYFKFPISAFYKGESQ